MSSYGDEEIKMFFDAKDLHRYAQDGLIKDIQIETFTHYGVSRATLNINGAQRCGVKITNRNKNKPDKEKLFKSITGVHQWAYKLMEQTWSQANGGKMGCPILTSRICQSKRINVDGIQYDENNPFDIDKHSDE